ncbi:AraC family transcriptional regulator [Paraburkholderia sediminicola]|uniref:AraC family transcriptional regulator n=1 Tax=Paraburkholderia sediminicola TaxID=458836 RepID=UPI0038B96F05
MLETPDTVVRLAPDRAAWIPAGLPHSVFMDRTFRYHSLYIDRSLYASDSFLVLAVKPLLKELIVDASNWTTDSLDFRQRYRKTLVIVDELKQAPLSSTGIQIPDDRRIAAICRELESDPSIGKSIEAWARDAGASEKTIQRAFVASTGQTFQQWRHHVRMTRALELHARGMRLLDIAVSVGYATEGAYSQAFKKFYGHPPSLLRSRKL